MADSLVAGWLSEIGLEGVIPTFREVCSSQKCAHAAVPMYRPGRHAHKKNRRCLWGSAKRACSALMSNDGIDRRVSTAKRSQRLMTRSSRSSV